MDTSFEMVSKLNLAFGNKKGDLSAPDWDKIEAQSKNIFDEYNELMQAIDERDMVAVADAYADIAVFNEGIAHICGFNGDAVMIEVQNSNMSKFCDTQEGLSQTYKKYTDLGICISDEGDYPLKIVRSVGEQTDVNGKMYRANKFLKSVNFVEPDLKQFVE